MSYFVQTVNFPSAISGTPSCKQQHEDWAAQKKEIQARAVLLGRQAEECLARKEEYNCIKQKFDWRQAKSLYDSRVKCEQAAQEYQALVDKVDAENAALRKAYEAKLAEVNQTNYARAQSYKGAQMTHAQAVSAWERQMQAYRTWLAYKSSIIGKLNIEWLSTKAKYPFLKNYTNYRYTYACGVQWPCISQSMKSALVSKCQVVKGLGATNAGDCQNQYLPVCPTFNCPPQVGYPGAKPAPPQEPSYLPKPPEPVYQAAPSWITFANSKGLPASSNTPNCPTHPDPGPKPSCVSPEPGRTPPSPPNCEVPGIPEVPPAPTCKPSLFGQVGPMWLVLAAGGAGLWYLTKKK